MIGMFVYIMMKLSAFLYIVKSAKFIYMYLAIFLYMCLVESHPFITAFYCTWYKIAQYVFIIYVPYFLDYKPSLNKCRSRLHTRGKEGY